MGEGREPWVGPYEDDITHAYQYAYSGTTPTALIVNSLIYQKEARSATGMRAHYNHERAVALQRMFPETAKITVLAKKSNGKGEPRVFHKMAPESIRSRTPLVITDPELFGQTKAYISEMAAEWYDEVIKGVHVRVQKRADRAAARRQGAPGPVAEDPDLEAAPATGA